MSAKPLVLLYKTPFGYYFYETARNEIVAVNEKLYRYISDILSEDVSEPIEASETTREEYLALQECGYLSLPYIQKVRHPLTDQLPRFLARKINKVTLQVTQNCNLRCSYCIYSENNNFGQRSHSAKTMPLEVAKKALEFYKSHSLDSDKASITFYGGEPLLEFLRIKEIVSYAEDIFEGKEILFSITTNATLLSEEVIDFLSEHNFIIMLSIDGPKKVQDSNRRFKNGQGSFDTVMKNISLLYRKNPDQMKNITISMVIDPTQDYSEIIKLFHMPEFKDVKLSYSMVEEDAETLPPSKDYLTKFNYDLFLAYMEYFRGDKKQYPNKLVERDMEAYKSCISHFKTNILSSVAAPGGPCVPGKLRLFVNAYGELYPCERVNEDCCMKIGTVDNGFDYDQISSLLNVGQLTAEHCKLCWAFPRCTICAKRADDEGVMSVSKKNAACYNSKAAAYETITYKVLSYENEMHTRKMADIRNGDFA